MDNIPSVPLHYKQSKKQDTRESDIRLEPEYKVKKEFFDTLRLKGF